MKKLLAVIVVVAAVLCAAFAIMADGIVTTPVNNPATSFKIVGVVTSTGATGQAPPSVVISIVYLDAQSAIVRIDTIMITSPFEIDSLCSQLETSFEGEDVSDTAGVHIKRYRQRLTKWLVDNGKITNVTPE